LIGFDRELKPEWIYKTLLLSKYGQKLGELNRPFEDIANDIGGKEAIRKIRTVLFRIFLRDEKRINYAKEKNILKELSQNNSIEFMKPIYLFYIIGKTDVLIDISKHLLRLYDFGTEINANFLRQKMINASGDRDVVRRSVGRFLDTLENFEIIKKMNGKIYLDKKLHLEEKQLLIILKLLFEDIMKTTQISLNHLPEMLLNFFEYNDIKIIAHKYNGIYWDYQIKISDEFINYKKIEL